MKKRNLNTVPKSIVISIYKKLQPFVNKKLKL